MTSQPTSSLAVLAEGTTVRNIARSESTPVAKTRSQQATVWNAEPAPAPVRIVVLRAVMRGFRATALGYIHHSARRRA